MHLLGFGEWLAVGAVADDVVGRETLGLVQLGRLQHPQADIDDHIRRAFNGHGDRCQAVTGGNSWCGRCNIACITGAVIAEQECHYTQCTGFNFRGQLKVNQRAFAATALRDREHLLFPGPKRVT